jgi:hypothetical protein
VAMWTSARQTKRMIIISLLNASAHNLLYGGGCPSSRVSASVCKGVSVSVLNLEMLLHGDDDFRSTNKVQVLFIVSLLNGKANSRLYGGVYSHNRVCDSVSIGVEIDITYCIVACLHSCNSN